MFVSLHGITPVFIIGAVVRDYFVSPFNIFIVNKFSLSPALRALLAADSLTNHPELGERLPVSVRQRGSMSQSIRVYPEDGYDFFMGCEVARIYRLASDFDLMMSIESDGSQVYITITEYLN